MKLNGGELYVFNSANTLEHIVPFAAGSTSESFQTTTGMKTFYFVGNRPGTANLGGPLPAVVSTTSLNDYEKAVATLQTPLMEDITRVMASPEGDFFITSTGKITFRLVPGGSLDAPGNNLTIPVGRAMAKANVEYDAGQVAQPASGTLAGVKYMIRQNPKEMYFVPNFQGAQPVSAYHTRSTGTTAPVSGDYFDNGSVTYTGGITAPVIDFGVNDLIPVQSYAGDATGNKDSYMMENSNQAVKYGNATYALLQGAFTPATSLVADANGTAATYIAGTDFYRVELLDATGTSVGYNSRFFTATPLPAVLTAIQADPLFPIGGSVQVRKYVTGLCYYFLYFKDGSKASVAEQYTVARNFYFYATVTSVGDCGSNIPVPETPNEIIATDTFLGVAITVTDWGLQEQHTGI